MKLKEMMETKVIHYSVFYFFIFIFCCCCYFLFRFLFIFIPLYNGSFPSKGQVTIPDEITFQLEDVDTPVFTLTCTSTGGPVSTVSWRRDGTMLSDDITYSIASEVTDGTTSTYTHTVRVTGRLLGEYECNVSGIRTPSGITRSLTVGKNPKLMISMLKE